MLVHRYSSSDVVGTTLLDSVGGSAWNGTLPRGGTLSGGQLILSSNLQQYVQFPAGVLSNYTAVTIEAWVTFPDQLPVNCFFFGFGNTNGNVGVNYIFCAPRAGRAAITGGSNPGEQNAYTGVDFSYHTNFHLAFVFDPPAGHLAIYTNGLLAGINNSVTIGFALDEFRIYSGALDANDIAASQVLGPDQLLSDASPVIGVSAADDGNLTLSWPAASPNFTVMTTTNLAAGVWLPAGVTPQLVGNQWQVIEPPSDDARYFRLQN